MRVRSEFDREGVFRTSFISALATGRISSPRWSSDNVRLYVRPARHDEYAWTHRQIQLASFKPIGRRDWHIDLPYQPSTPELRNRTTLIRPSGNSDQQNRNGSKAIGILSSHYPGREDRDEPTYALQDPVFGPHAGADLNSVAKTFVPKIAFGFG